MAVVELNSEPSGLKIVIKLKLMVTSVILRLIRWPAVPSKRYIATLLAVEIVNVLLSPRAITPWASTSAAVNGGGGTKK